MRGEEVYMAQSWSSSGAVGVGKRVITKAIHPFEPQSVNSHAVDILSSNIRFVAGAIKPCSDNETCPCYQPQLSTRMRQ